MPRPPKSRRVEFLPEIRFFKPAGVRRQDLEEVVLNIEELEAIRLKDIEELTQEECADKMEISRPTFQRVLTSARQKIATALINGMGIRIQGGDYDLALSHFNCRHCGREIELPVYKALNMNRINCPYCGEEFFRTAGRKRRNRNRWQHQQNND